MSRLPGEPAPLSLIALAALTIAIFALLAWPLAILALLLSAIAVLQMRDGSYRGRGYLYATWALAAIILIAHFTALF